ncbi:MAG: single-stranded-DNA-specific exonuclease RecJ [Eubacterium sp.]|nr:single-stranded-DNA-specific exonuclease RecJ [Eubacterium sp.]
MQEKWVVAAKRADFNAIAEKYGIDPVTARLIRNRDVIGDEAIGKYLYGSPEDLYEPERMKDMTKAAAFLLEAVRSAKKIRIIGDYDIDGVMSSYILLRSFSRMGADVDVRIPDRIRDGYGLNERLVRAAAEDGRQVLLTCDNGIAASAELELAYELGLQAVVTDHHEVPYQEGDDGVRKMCLPRAEAVIDPKRADCAYPFKGLCGAAVAWKLICCMYRMAGIPRAEADELIAYAAFATVGDVMDLKDENRILVREGLKQLRRTDNPGLQELISQNGIEPQQLDVYHIGFILGPCLNASGRLDTAGHALALLAVDRREEAAKLAGDLIALNANRKDMTIRNEAEAQQLIETSGLARDRVMVVYLPDCHESLAGIVAGRLKERYHRPVFVLTQTAGGVKGSGRSVEAYNMYEGLCACREYLTKFGGHPMAAGISLQEDMIEPFRRQINAACALTEEDLQPRYVIDVPMPISYVTENLIRELDCLKPFGKGNTKPVFAQKGLAVLGARVFGKNRNVVKCRLADSAGRTADAVYFGDGDAFISYISSQETISVIYYPGIDTFRGRNSIQIVITNYR